MTRVDTDALEIVINTCLENSMDLRFTPQQRAEFLETGYSLRPQLLKLLSAEFTDNTPQVAEVNRQLKALNTALRAGAANLAETASTLANVARLVGTIDGLLGLVV